MKVLKFLLGLVVFVIVAALLIALAVPRWLSSEGGKRFLLKQANANVEGTVNVELLSLSWFRGVSVDGVSFDDKEGRPVLRVASVQGTKSLLQLVRNYQDLGELRIEKPQVYVHIPEPAAEPAEAPKDPGKKPEAVETKEEAAPLLLPEIMAHLTLEGGTLYKVDPGAEPVAVVQNLNLEVKVDGLRSPILYEVSLDAGRGEGKIRGKGTIDLAREGKMDPDAVSVDTLFEIMAWDLADTLALVGASGNIPKGEGTLNGSLRVVGSAAAGIDVAARVDAANLSFSGGPLKGDTPTLGTMELAVTGRLQGASAVFDPVMITSELGSLKAAATLVDGTPSALSASGRVNLAAITAQFPRSLGLKEGVRVNEGMVDLSASLVQEEGNATIEAALLMNRLQGVSEGRPLSWDQPVDVRLKMVQGPNVLRVESLKAQTPFLQAEGKGDLSDLSVSVQSDLGRALTELGKFIDLRPWEAGGNVKAEIRLTSDAAATEEGFRKPTRAQARATISGEGVTVHKGATLLVPPGPMTLQLETQLVMSEAGAVSRIEAPSLSWDLWLGQGSMVARSVTPAPKGLVPQMEGAAAKGRLDLNQINALLSALGSLPESTELGGMALFDVGMDAANDRLQISKAQLSLAQFSFRQGEKALPVQNLSLHTSGSVDLAEKSAAFPELALETSAGALTLREVRIADWTRAAESLSITADGDLDLARLVAALGSFASLPEKTELSGTLKLNAGVKTAPDGQTLSLDAALNELLVRVDGEVRVQEPKPVTLTARVQQSASGTRVERLELGASPASLSMNGNLARSGTQSSLDAQGNLALDLTAVTGYLQSLLGLELVMAGRQERPFSFKAAWEEGEMAAGLMAAEAEAGFHADSIQAFGLNISDLDVPFVMKDRRAALSLRGVVNEGELNVHPSVDFAADPPMLAMPADTNLFRNVHLTEELSNELLGKIHPLFKGARGVDGRLDLSMLYFEWPLPETHAAQRRFKGTLDLRDMTMTSSGLWGALMKFAKMNEREMEVKDERIEFELKDARIHCSPIGVDIGQKEKLVLSGSVGLDKTLDYTASMPVSESMARSVGISAQDYTNYVAGTSIKVPIRGTVDDPDMSSTVLRDMAVDLAKQAASRALQQKAGQVLEGLFKK